MAWNIAYIAQAIQGVFLGEDETSRSLKTVSPFDVALHEGKLWRFGAQKDVSSSGTFNLVTTIPVGLDGLHFFPSVECEVEAEITLYEDPTNLPTGGTTVTPRNANRNFADNSTLTVVFDATLDLTGATLIGKIVVGARKSTGGANSGSDIVLKAGSTYIQVITNQASTANEVTIANLAYTH